MLDRRESAREKVVQGEADRIPKEQTPPCIAAEGDSILARISWWRDRFVGVAFGSEQPFQLPFSDLEQRLRKSEKKKRQLQRRITKLLGEG